MPEVLPQAARRVDGAVKIEMHVPFARLSLLKQEMEDRLRPVLFVKATARIFVVSKPAREIVPPRQRRFNHRPRFKLQTHATFTVYVSHSFYEMPELLRMQPVQQQQCCLLLVERKRIERRGIRQRAP